MSFRQLLTTTLAVVLAFAAGWVWGASGKAGVELARRDLDDRADLAVARAETLDGRVKLVQQNFGDAGQRFARAQGLVEKVQLRWRETAQTERVGHLEVVLSHLKEARRLCAALDATAQDAAAEAGDALETIIDALPAHSASATGAMAPAALA